MYLRFVYSTTVNGMKARQGIFQAAAELFDHPTTTLAVRTRLEELRLWFDANLDRPDRFSKTKSRTYHGQHTKGLSWFKPFATDHISKAFELKAILEENEYTIELIKERRLGYVVYEDAYQIVAEPFFESLI